MISKLVVGITGPMGAGKNFVASVFEKFGYTHFDVDKIAKRVTDQNLECKVKLKNTFGENVLDEDLSLNRPVLGLKAFNSPENLLKLGQIVNPYISKEVEKLILREKDKIILNAANLCKSEMSKLCRYKVYVTASSEIRCERIVKRDKMSKETAMKRIKSQNRGILFNEKFDFIVDGNLKKEEILKKISEMVIKIENL